MTRKRPCKRAAHVHADAPSLRRADLLVAPECLNPVGADRALGRAESQLPGADACMEPVLELVLLVEARGRVCRFGPEVADLVRPAELERDQVVDLVLAR